MALSFGSVFSLYCAVGVGYWAWVIYGLTHNRENPAEGEIMAEILRQHLRLQVLLLLFFTFCWLPWLIYSAFKFLRSTDT